jgi:hypothetical protein
MAFKVDQAERLEDLDGCQVWRCQHHPGKVSHVIVTLLSNQEPHSHLLIERVTLGGVQLNDINVWSTYRLRDTGQCVPPTHGWIDRPGEYRLRIRHNALVHNYVSYFYNISPSTAS